MKKFIDNYLTSISDEKPFKIQSFTYFIPAPKQFSQPYREKQFDRLFYQFINKGYQILEIKTEQCSNDSGAGMWIIIIVQAKNKQASELNLEEEFNNALNSECPDQDQSDDFEIIPE